MKPIFALCLFSIFLASPSFGIIMRSEPFYKDTVRDTKTGELYRVRVSSIFICRESKSKNPEQGYGFEMALEYELERYVSSEKPMICPDGWEKRPTALNKNLSECVYSVPLSPLTFFLDTGENRKRHFSKAERASALKQCNDDLGSVPLSLLLAGGGGCRSSDGRSLPILDFTYQDKAGKLHEVSFVRDYGKPQKRFISWIRYPLDSGKCDKGWILEDWSEERKLHPDRTYLKNECHYIIPDPPLFTPKKGKRPKKSGKAR